MYLDKGLPDETGLQKSLCFCLKKKSDGDTRNSKAAYLDEESTAVKTSKNEILKVDHLVREFGSFRAVDDISFSIKSNKVTCILGHNGAGKSTLINMLCGIIRSSSGKIYFKGKDVGVYPEVLDG